MGYRMAKKKPVAKQAPKKQAVKPVKVLAPKKSAKAPAQVSTKNPAKTPVKAPVVAKPTRKPVKKVSKPLTQEPLTEVLSAPPATLPEPFGDVETLQSLAEAVKTDDLTQEPAKVPLPSWWPPDPMECER